MGDADRHLDANASSDAFVFFGATGNLAFKEIFPALFHLIRDGFDLPIIGVARSGNLDALRERARQSVGSIGISDPETVRRLVSRLRYVKGEIEDADTYRRLRQELDGSDHPLHYLAVPPSLFPAAVRHLGRSGCAQGARVIVEKPFGRDLASARQLNAVLREVFPDSAVFRIDHYPGQGASPEPGLLPLRELVPRADLECESRGELRDHDGRGVRRRGARRLLRRGRCHSGRRPEPSAPGDQPDGHGATVGQQCGSLPQREVQGP